MLFFSDLDLCLVLDENVASLAENEEEGEKEDNTRDSREILERLGSLIRKKIPYLYCQYKTRARIPVIKLYARRQIIGGFGSNWNHFNADISVGNVLAISNTRLLKAYCNVDERFKSLVLFCE